MRHLDQRAGDDHAVKASKGSFNLRGVSFQQSCVPAWRIDAPTLHHRPFGSGYAGLGDGGASASRPGLLLRRREEDGVFEMDVTMQILLQVLQSGKEGAVGVTGLDGR